jgi:hypothetical protein
MSSLKVAIFYVDVTESLTEDRAVLSKEFYIGQDEFKSKLQIGFSSFILQGE